MPLHLKQTFLPKIWIFIEGEGEGIKSRLFFDFFFYFTTGPMYTSFLDFSQKKLTQISMKFEQIEQFIILQLKTKKYGLVFLPKKKSQIEKKNQTI